MAFGSKVKKLCKRALRLPIMLEIVLMLIAAYCALNYAGIMCACLMLCMAGYADSTSLIGVTIMMCESC